MFWINSPSKDGCCNTPNWKANNCTENGVCFAFNHSWRHLECWGEWAIPWLCTWTQRAPWQYLQLGFGDASSLPCTAVPHWDYFTRWFFCKDQELIMFYYCSDLCVKVPWPEPQAWKSWFFKVKPDGELTGKKDQFYRTVPSYIYCLNPFYLLWHTVIQISLQAHFIQISL